MHKTTLSFLTLAAFGLLSLHAASAQTTAPAPKDDLMPPVTEKSAGPALTDTDSDTHPALKLTPDKSELVRLDKDAASVVVGSPSQISVVLDTPRLAVVIPRSPGATYFTVLDKDGNVIMQRHVIVDAPKKNYVRIRRSCGKVAAGTPCQATSVYFCPDMCHEIKGGSDDQGGSSSSSSSSAPSVPAPQ